MEPQEGAGDRDRTDVPWIKVSVVDENGEPVRDARIAVFEDTANEIHELLRWVKEGGNWLPGTGDRWSRTDESGNAMVHPRFLWNRIAAVTPRKSGSIIVPVDAAREVSIRIEPHRYWKVRVLDPQGKDESPRVHVKFWLEKRVTPDFRHRVLPDGPENIAVFGPLNLIFDPEEIDPVLVASLDMLALARPSVRMLSSQVGIDASVLEIPPYGSLEVRLWRDGKLIGDGVQVFVVEEEVTQDWNSGQSVETKNGSAIFSPIALGTRLDVDVEKPWVRSRSEKIVGEPFSNDDVIEGLVNANETRVLNFEASRSFEQLITLSGRVANDRGESPQERWIGLRVWDSRGMRLLTKGANLDESGEFDVTILLPEEISGALHLVVTTHRVQSSDEEYEAWGELSFEILGGDAVIDTGTIELQPVPILVSGRVLDDQGRPIHGIRVGVEPEDGVDIESIGPPWWTFRFNSASDTDPEGRFEIRGFGGESQLSLTSGGGLLKDEDHGVIPPGSEPMRVKRTLGWAWDEATSQIMGNYLLDSNVPFEVISTVLVKSGQHALEEDELLGHQIGGLMWDATGDRFGSARAPVGTWDLVVILGGSSQVLGQSPCELARIPNVTVSTGKTTVVPPIDLRGKIRVRHLRMTDKEGGLIPAGHIFCLGTSTFDGEYDTFHDAHYTLCTSSEWPQFEILGLGCRVWKLGATGRDKLYEELEVVLEPAMKLVVSLPDEIEIPKAEFPDEEFSIEVSLHVLSWEPSLFGSGFWLDPFTGDEVFLGIQRSREMRLPAAGAYVLDVTLNYGDDSASILHDVSFEWSVEQDGSTFKLPISQNMVDDAWAQVRR